MGYDKPIAYPTSSFNEPVQPPDAEADAEPTVQVCFSEAWLPLVLGSLSQLQLQSTWIGDADAIFLAQGRATNLKGLFSTPNCPASDVETPYWDSDEDVGLSEPADTQTWYGEVTNPDAPPGELDFVENVIVWTFTGLLALASAEIAFAPAILFHTLAPRFIIAMRTADVAEVFRIVVNGQDYARVNTTGHAPGEIINQTIVIDAPTDDNTLLILTELA